MADALFTLDVIEVTHESLDVRFPNGTTVRLHIAESDQREVRSALIPKPVPDDRGWVGASCIWCDQYGHLGIDCDDRRGPRR